VTRFRTVQGLNPANWLLIPAAVSAAASLLLTLPIKLWGLQPPEPVFAMVLAFAWAVIRPSVLPPFLLVGLGLFNDLLWGGALGLWPLILLAVYALAYSLRSILGSEGFWALGAWYAAASAVGLGVGVMLVAFVADTVPNLIGVALQFGVTVPLFPLVWLLVERFEDADVRFR
jgi:rod shape-determining protein MreD